MFKAKIHKSTFIKAATRGLFPAKENVFGPKMKRLCGIPGLVVEG